MEGEEMVMPKAQKTWKGTGTESEEKRERRWFDVARWHLFDV
jgi:hypothetical protein